MGKLNRKQIHDSIHLFSLLLIAVGLSVSKILLSLGTILILANFVFEGHFRIAFQNWKNQPLLKWVFAYFFLHLLGLIWSSDLHYGWADIRIKLPFIILPFVLVAKPIKTLHIRYLLLAFVAGVLVTSIINVAAFYQLFGERIYHDMRELSLFGSHIRYSILIVLAIWICWLERTNFSNKFHSIALLIIFWLMYYTIFSQVLSGILALFSSCIIYITYLYYQRAKGLVLASITLSFLLLIGFIYFLIPPKKITLAEINALPNYTALGNAYTDDYTLNGTCNGYPIRYRICDQELEATWNKRSTIDYYGRDGLNQRIRTTIIRYLSSKKLSKDAAGIAQLSAQDIQQIEKGIPSVNETKWGIIGRLYGLQYQIENHSDPNGHSILQRLEYWKTAMNIIKNNWLIGVGTGDVQLTFNRYYKQQHSILKPENQLRAHNTYLTSWVSFGVFGLITFLSFILVGLKQFKQNLFGLLFMAIFALTSIIEDTLETQVGACYVAFFLGLMLVKSSDKKNVFNA